MVNKDLIQRLHDKSIIDKRHVLWWQLGFEERRILTEEEFERGLETESWEVTSNPPILMPIKHTSKAVVWRREMEFRFWKRDDVPILIRNIHLDDMDGIEVPCFVTVKPKSHGYGGFSIEKEFHFKPAVNYQPHIRGVVIEEKDNFLFWYPFTFGTKPNSYATTGRYMDEEGMWCITHPVDTHRFYKNIVQYGWSKGRRAQKKAKEFNCEEEGFKVVPYFEFDPDQKHVMVYPVNLFEDKLDFPVFIKTVPERPKVEVLGVGYARFNNQYSGAPYGGSVYYWELPGNMRKAVRRTLEQALE